MRRAIVIGYGGQGEWHCRQILRSDVVTLNGVYDIDPEKQKKASMDGIKVYVSLEEAYKDETNDIVVVATPNDSHLQLVKQALGAGKNVICEKPAEMSAASVTQMIQVADKNEKLFTVHHNRRWDIDFLAMKKISEEGKIGKIMRLESRIHGSRGIPSDWRCIKEKGGGMLFDWGVHLIDQVLQIITDDRVIRLSCNMTYITGTEVDDGFGLTLYFESGKTAYVEVGTYNFLSLPRFYMQCEKGTAKIDVWNQKAHVARLKAWNEKDVLPVPAGAGITKTMAPRDKITLEEYDVEKQDSDVHDFYRNFCAVLEKREDLIVRHEEILRVMKIMDAAMLSAKTKQIIDVSI